MTESLHQNRMRVFLGALLGGSCAAALWILVATVNAIGAGIFIWPLGIGAGLGARWAGGRDKTSGYVAAAVALVTILIGDAIALRQSIAYFRARIQVPEQAYEARRAQAELWVNRPPDMSRDEAYDFRMKHRIGLDYSDPAYEDFLQSGSFADRDLYFDAVDEQLVAFHESPPSPEQYLERKLTERRRLYDEYAPYRGAWKRLYGLARYILLGLAALSAYLTVQGRPVGVSSPGEG